MPRPRDPATPVKRRRVACSNCGLFGHYSLTCEAPQARPSRWNGQRGVRCNLCASLPHLRPAVGTCACGGSRYLDGRAQ
jgi:hypothetical protein